MSDEIKIPEESSKYLNKPARDELSKVSNYFINEVLQEASRIEATENSTGRDPEITSSMIKEAAHFIKKGYKRNKKPKWYIISQIIQSIFILLSGILFDFEKLKDPAYFIIFLVVIIIAVTSTVLVTIKEW